MRILLLAALAAVPVALAACDTYDEYPTAAPYGPGYYRSAYDIETNRLAAACANRGGVLTPNGRASGDARIDHDCRIRGDNLTYPY
jgi:hypothetical protein